MLVEESPKNKKRRGSIRKSFDEAFIVALEEGLSILGHGKDTIYLFLEYNCSLRKEDIPNKTKLFESMLSEMLGPTSTRLIEELILYKLFNILPVEICSKLKRRGPFRKIIEEVKKKFDDYNL